MIPPLTPCSPPCSHTLSLSLFISPAIVSQRSQHYILTITGTGKLNLTATPSGTPYESLNSDDVYINGDTKLVVNDDGLLPAYPIAGQAAAAGTSVVLPSLSYGFVAFSASVAACA